MPTTTPPTVYAGPTIIRSAVEDDRLALFKLAVRMHAETDFRHIRISPGKVLSNLGVWIHSPTGLMLVAERDGHVCGFFAGKCTQPWYSDDVCAVEDCFYVEPEARGSRAAYLLVRQFLQWSRDVGARHVRAGISSGAGEAGARLYEHFGLKHMGGNYVLHLN